MGATPYVLQLIRSIDNARIVEIGVAQAKSAVKYLSLPNVSEYIGVDPWQKYQQSPDPSFQEGYLDRKMGLWQTDQDWEEVYQRACSRLEPFGDRARLIRAFSHQAVDQVDGDLDVVSIDGNHQFEYALRDMELWWDKIRPGGLMLLDDYDCHGGSIIGGRFGGRKACQVDLACEAFCKARDLDWYVSQGQACIHKPHSELASLKDKHKGQRCFIIGNGPSLNLTDLDLIAGEQTIAMNRISLLYDRTSWRPSYYVYMSDNVDNPNWGEPWQQSVTQAVACPQTTSFIWRRYAHAVHEPGNVIWLDSITEQQIGTDGTFSTNAAQYISKTGTTMNAALQLAFHLGFDPVIILGADLNWVTSGSDAKSDPNHFDPNYSARIPDGERERARMRETHQRVREIFRSHGREIYNATISTFLDTYPLVDYTWTVKHPDHRFGWRDQARLSVFCKRMRIWWYWAVQHKLARRNLTCRNFLPRLWGKLRRLGARAIRTR
ncbi:MAG: class I SAM-dependent methyltransferase [Phycisphaerae bacterium]